MRSLVREMREAGFSYRRIVRWLAVYYGGGLDDYLYLVRRRLIFFKGKK